MAASQKSSVRPASNQSLRSTPPSRAIVHTYNHLITQHALDHCSPVQALQQWRSDKPKLFRKLVNDLPVLDMTNVSILVTNGNALLQSIVSLFKIFHQANDVGAAAGRDAVFNVHLVGAGYPTSLYGGLYSVRPDRDLTTAVAADVVIVPALAGDIAEGLKRNAAGVVWLKEQYRAGAEIAALCTGAFFIAETGLIGDARRSGRWFVDATFKKQFAQINLLGEGAAAEEDEVCSSGGAYGFIQRMVESAAGKEIAAACADMFAAPFNRECQSVVTVSNTRGRETTRLPSEGRQPLESDSKATLTRQQFAALFEVSERDRRRGTALAKALDRYLQMPAATAVPDTNGAGCETASLTSACAANSTTLRRLLKQLPARAATGVPLASGA